MWYHSGDHKKGTFFSKPQVQKSKFLDYNNWVLNFYMLPWLAPIRAIHSRSNLVDKNMRKSAYHSSSSYRHCVFNSCVAIVYIWKTFFFVNYTILTKIFVDASLQHPLSLQNCFRLNKIPSKIDKKNQIDQ